MPFPQSSPQIPLFIAARVRQIPARFSVRPALFAAALGFLAFAVPIPARAQQATPVLLDAMTTELNRAFTSLGKTGASEDRKLPPYFLSYSISDASIVSVRAQFGALVDSQSNHVREADVQVRVGAAKLDNTHGTHRGSAVHSMQMPITDDREALQRTLWLATNAGYRNALDSYLRVKTEAEVRAKEEDTSPDFSQEAPQTSIGKPAPPIHVDMAAWKERVADLSKIFRSYPDVYQNTVALSVENETDYFASSEGSRIVAPHLQARLVVFAMTRADDGMDLFRARTFEAETIDGLPSQAEMESEIRKLGDSLETLRKAPLTEPFDGPAILSGRAAAVFFHEVLGHRLEGQRQRGDEEGQTFTKDIGKEVLPTFLSVSDDPTLTKYGDTWLSGSFDYDDEGQKARRVDLIQDGVLKTFLMSRLPIASFANSNGHGRAQAGKVPTGRQGNLIVTSTKTVSDAQLRKQLIDKALEQGKPYGLYFEDISSGFAVTTRSSPQAFQVIPLVVYRVYVDGRPDELVRGVKIVGTPLAAMKRIVSTSDKSEVFNGECGAESGTVPVSAVAPAMLLSEIETQKQSQGTARPPILPIPGADDHPTKGAAPSSGTSSAQASVAVVSQAADSDFITLPQDLGCELVTSGSVQTTVTNYGTVHFPDGTSIKAMICGSRGHAVEVPLASNVIAHGSVSTSSFGEMKVSLQMAQSISSVADMGMHYEFSILRDRLQAFKEFLGQAPQSKEAK